MQWTYRGGYLLLEFVALSAFCLTTGCSRPTETRSEVARPVKTMVVAAGEQPLVRTFPGRVEASKNVELAFQVPGLTRQPTHQGGPEYRQERCDRPTSTG